MGPESAPLVFSKLFCRSRRGRGWRCGGCRLRRIVRTFGRKGIFAARNRDLFRNKLILLAGINDGRGDRSVPAQDRKGEGGDHEEDGRSDGELAQEGGGAAAAENGLARSPEGGPRLGPYAGREQNDPHQDETDVQMNDYDEYVH